MSGFSLEMVHTAVSYWLGALSEPVLIVTREEMQQSAAGGAIVWDVRSEQAYRQAHMEGALSLGSIDWLLAENSGGNLIPGPVIKERLRKVGIHEGRTVIVYADDRAVDAFVALRALRSIGIRDAQACLGDGAGHRARPAQVAQVAQVAQASVPHQVRAPSRQVLRVPAATAAVEKSAASAIGPAGAHPGKQLKPSPATHFSAMHEPA